MANTQTSHERGAWQPAEHLCLSQEEKPGVRQELVCAFWKADSSGVGRWSTSGCRLMGSANRSSTCVCTHLSSFAILMAHYNVQVSRCQGPAVEV